MPELQRETIADRDLVLHTASLCYRLRLTEQEARAIAWGVINAPAEAIRCCASSPLQPPWRAVRERRTMGGCARRMALVH